MYLFNEISYKYLQKKLVGMLCQTILISAEAKSVNTNRSWKGETKTSFSKSHIHVKWDKILENNQQTRLWFKMIKNSTWSSAIENKCDQSIFIIELFKQDCTNEPTEYKLFMKQFQIKWSLQKNTDKNNHSRSISIENTGAGGTNVYCHSKWCRERNKHLTSQANSTSD